MSSGPLFAFRPSTVSQVEPGEMRLRQTSTPTPESGSTGENKPPRPSPVFTPIHQDVIKVQLKPPGEIVVFQFVDQQGTVVLQVPPQQMIELAQQISEELTQKPSSQTVAEGGKSNGH